MTTHAKRQQEISMLMFSNNWRGGYNKVLTHPFSTDLLLVLEYMHFVGWMQEGRKCILMIFQEERFSVLQQDVHRK